MRSSGRTSVACVNTSSLSRNRARLSPGRNKERPFAGGRHRYFAGSRNPLLGLKLWGSFHRSRQASPPPKPAEHRHEAFRNNKATGIGVQRQGNARCALLQNNDHAVGERLMGLARPCPAPHPSDEHFAAARAIDFRVRCRDAAKVGHSAPNAGAGNTAL